MKWDHCIRCARRIRALPDEERPLCFQCGMVVDKLFFPIGIGG